MATFGTRFNNNFDHLYDRTGLKCIRECDKLCASKADAGLVAFCMVGALLMTAMGKNVEQQ